MTVSLKLLDHVQLNSRLHANFACDYSEDGKIFILTESGVYVLTLKGYTDNVFPRFSFRKDFIKLTGVSLAEQALDSNISTSLKDFSREHLFETLLDVGLSGNVIDSTPLEAKPVFAMWSPRGIIEKTDGAIAVLTNLNNIEIYVEVLDENEIMNFMCVVNFAKDISEHYRKSWKSFSSIVMEEKFLEMKRRIDYITPTAFTWSHVILRNQKACCILFVGHRDGSISAWRFYERKISDAHESKLEFLERYNTGAKCITALHWFCRRSDAGGLSFGDSEGRIGALSVEKLSTDSINFCCETLLSEPCELKVEKIMIMTYENITFVISVLKNYLLVHAIDDCGEVFQGKYISVGDLYITGILHYEQNILLVLSVCGLLKQIELSIRSNELVYTEKTVQLNMDTNKYRTHGFLTSPNKVFLSVLAYPCQLKDVSKGKWFINFFMFGNTQKDPFKILMNLTANSLRDCWDCFETLRVQCIKDKVFPWEGIDKDLNYDGLPLLKLKILRWIAKLSEKIYSIIPKIEAYDIKAYVLLHYAVDIKLAVQRMTKLLNIYFSEKKLTLFQMRSMDLLNFFLKEMLAKDVLTKSQLGETFVDEIYDVMRIANQLQYPPMPQCQWCGEKIIGTGCVPPHADSRCAISLMPIHITPGYKCPFCKCVVCKEMEKEYYPIFCPYCDVPMKKRCFEKKKYSEEILMNQSSAMQNFKIKPEEIVTSDCFSDCLSENINFSDIEENDMQYVLLSDSEKEDGVSELYEHIKNLVISAPENELDDEIIESVEDVTSSTQNTEKGEQENDDDDADDNYEDFEIK